MQNLGQLKVMWITIFKKKNRRRKIRSASEGKPSENTFTKSFVFFVASSAMSVDNVIRALNKIDLKKGFIEALGCFHLLLSSGRNSSEKKLNQFVSLCLLNLKLFHTIKKKIRLFVFTSECFFLWTKK